MFAHIGFLKPISHGNGELIGVQASWTNKSVEARMKEEILQLVLDILRE